MACAAHRKFSWVFATVLVVAALMSADTRGEVAATAGRTSWVDVSSDAIQTFYQEGVPHTDRAGNVRLTYEPSVSFFPIGIYLPMPCRVGAGFGWPAFEGAPEWDGTYTLIVNRGHTRDVDDPEQVVARKNAGTNLSAILISLPASTDLYYSVWPNGVSETVAEGPFTTQACPPDDPDDPNFAETISRAGFDLALVSDPWASLALKDTAAGASHLKLVISSTIKHDFREGAFEEFKGDPSSGHPDVFGWYIADEPDFCWGTEDDCHERLDLARTYYEAHEGETSEVFFLTAGPGPWATEWRWWSQFIQVGDVAAHANYPKFWTPSLPSVHSVAERVGDQTTVVGEAKPSWVVLQSAAADQFPTPTEMRAMVYASIVHGATGIWHFLWDSSVARNAEMVGIRPDTPVSYPDVLNPDATVATPQQIAASVALWDSLDASQGGLNAELKTMEPVILAPTASSSDSYLSYAVLIDRQPSAWSPVQTMLKTVGGEQYLIAVNMDAVPLNARFQFVQGMSAVDIMFEDGRTITPYSGGFGDYFGPFAVHVYRFTFRCFEPRATRDYVVSISDLYSVLLRLAGSLNEGDHDVDGDGIITLADVILVARNLGTVCPH